MEKLSQNKGIFSQKKRYLFIDIIKNKNYLLLIKKKHNGKNITSYFNSAARC